MNKFSVFLFLSLFVISCENSTNYSCDDIVSVDMIRSFDRKICTIDSSDLMKEIIIELNKTKTSETIKTSPKYKIVLHLTDNQHVFTVGSDRTIKNQSGEYRDSKELISLVKEAFDRCINE